MRRILKLLLVIGIGLLTQKKGDGPPGNTGGEGGDSPPPQQSPSGKIKTSEGTESASKAVGEELDKGEPSAAASQSDSDSAPLTASSVSRDYGNEVAYPSTDPLAQEALAYRRGVKGNSGDKNFAAAELSDGTTLRGISSRSGHSEDDILKQLDGINQERAENGQEPLTIDRLFTERQPCCKCEATLTSNGITSDQVEYGVEYFDKPNATDEERENLNALNEGMRAVLEHRLKGGNL
ncbi:nucleic acid/nucleotide deaminase domain-containing protein [Glycomyces tenuis]|uniref:nucleic acid/nucleotide deaminase domain-containing protein n=1 Tax=Glycomyces tenuis TaxID=58116 RepID=UPI0004136A70|nr:nucleic acid/nucleotide deaminase domain-containing protein [Glycomyces tenuis]